MSDGDNSAGKTSRAIVMRLAVAHFYGGDGNGAGGNLHIVLDDGNLEDGHIQFCLEQAERAGDRDGVAIARELLKMSPDERRYLYEGDDDELEKELALIGVECADCERTSVRLMNGRPACSIHAENPPETKDSAAGSGRAGGEG